jgi:uncharacterized surface protein with fasciclin (FAS1) repeats
MGRIICFRAAASWIVAPVWFLVATSATIIPTAILSAKPRTSRNLKSYLKQKQQHRRESNISLRTQAQQSATLHKYSLSMTSATVSNVVDKKNLVRSVKGGMGMMRKGGKGYSDIDYSDGEEVYGKGKGKSKGMMKRSNKKGKGKSKKGELPKVCDKLDFRPGSTEDEYPGEGKGKGKGKGKGDQYDDALCEPNILDEAKGIMDLLIFVSLIKQAKLEEIFLCAGPFTILAPTNAAFAENPSITKYLSDESNVKELREVLLYHILPGLTLTDEFTQGPAETLQGDVIEVALNPIIFNAMAIIEEGDIIGCNGVIDVIDGILLPPGMNFVSSS